MPTLSRLLDGRRILVVDDASFILSIVSRLLREMGCEEVFTANGGMSALSFLQAAHCPQIDAIVLDHYMPDISGMMILKMIRAGETSVVKTMPVIMLTSASDEDYIRMASRLRVDAFLVKPISKVVLGTRIEKVLSSRIAGPPIPPPSAAQALPIPQPAPRLHFPAPRLPTPHRNFSRFELACEAAILRRIVKMISFFQRANPALRRQLPPLFLGSADFMEKLHTVLRVLIIPRLLENPAILRLGKDLPLAGLDSENFWERADDRLRVAIQLAWDSAWDELRLIEESSGGKTRLGVKELTKLLRRLLPQDDDLYYQPKIGNGEIDLFKSLLDTEIDWRGPLDTLWDSLRGLYEQEMDPAPGQEPASEGAFRDVLLKAFERFPPAWMDALVLSCYRVFPRINLAYLERFASNFGSGKIQRGRRLPHTVHFIETAEARPEIRFREMQERAPPARLAGGGGF